MIDDRADSDFDDRRVEPAAFFGGYLAGRRVRPPQKRRKAGPPERGDDRLAAQARREWENFLNYEGMEQRAGP